MQLEMERKETIITRIVVPIVAVVDGIATRVCLSQNGHLSIETVVECESEERIKNAKW